MLDRGRVVARGTPDQLKASLGGEMVRLHFADPITHQRALDCLDVVSQDGQLLDIDVATDGSASEVRSMLDRLETAGALAARISLHRPSLDDVFLSLTETTPHCSDSREMTR
jgi:ABC-2 type transport system ATP-binding protein